MSSLKQIMKKYKNSLIFDNEKKFHKFMETKSLSNINEKNGSFGFIHMLTDFYSNYKDDLHNFLLIEDLDINLKDINKNNALTSYCIRTRKEGNEVIKLLLKHSKIDVNLRNNDGWSALMVASRYASTFSTPKTVELLLEHPDIDVNISCGLEGWTPLIGCSCHSTGDDTIKTIKLLLKHPKIDINKKTNIGWTALMFSSRYSKLKGGLEENIRVLLEDPKIDVNMKNDGGSTAIELAYNFANLTSSYKTVKLLLSHPDIEFNV